MNYERVNFLKRKCRELYQQLDEISKKMEVEMRVESIQRLETKKHNGPKYYFVEDVKGSVPKFLRHLWEIMKNEKGCQWSEEGDVIIITDLDEFTDSLSIYFDHNNFTSFRRQMTYYNFSSETIECQLHFRHRFFHRDYPEKILEVSRKKTWI